MKITPASRIYRDYLGLLISQEEAPDYPYEGIPYAGTWGAQGQRESFWEEIYNWHGEEISLVHNAILERPHNRL